MKSKKLISVITISTMIAEMALMSPVFAANTNLIAPNPTGLVAPHRIAGTTRYLTADALSEKFTSANTVIIASGENFPDALAAAPLAKQYNAPIILASPDGLDSVAISELTRLKASKAIIIGGTGSVSDNVEAQLSSIGVTASRIAGANRYETSLLVAKQVANPSAIVIASGESFPDALGISSIAAQLGMPIILAGKAGLSSDALAYIKSTGVSKTYIVGGTGVLPSSIDSAVPNAVRLAGANRYATDLQVLNQFGASLNFNNVYLATGENFADALAGSAVSSKDQAPLVLVPSTLGDDANAYLAAHMNLHSKAVALGGTSVISDAVIKNVTDDKAKIQVAKAYSTAGTYSNDTINGNAIISAADVNLKNVTINGDLLIASTVNDGNIDLDGVKVFGKIILNGAGSHSVHIHNMDVASAEIDKVSGEQARIVTDSTSSVASTTVDNNGDVDETTASKPGTVVVGQGATVTLTGTFDTVSVTGSNATVDVQNATVATLAVAPEAEQSLINTSASTTITTLNVSAPVNVTGNAVITTANIGADGVSIDAKPATVAVVAGVTAEVAGTTASVSNGTATVINSVPTTATDNTNPSSTPTTPSIPSTPSGGSSGSGSTGGSGGHSSDTVNVSGLTLNESTANIVFDSTASNTIQLTATVTPSNAANTTVKWSSSDTSVATVDSNGLVTALKAGTVVITAASEANPYAAASCKITVALPDTTQEDSGAVASAKAALDLGDLSNVTANLTLPTTGEDGTTISWNSDTPDVISNNGTVVQPTTAAATVVLTATITKGTESDTKTFTATVPPAVINPMITVTVKNPDGTLAASGNVSIQLLDASGSTAIDPQNGDMSEADINNGRALIGRLADGLYYIHANTNENSPYANSLTKIIQIINGTVSPASDANIELDFTNPMITGTVKNPDGTLAASGHVNIYQQNVVTTQSATFVNSEASINNGKFLLGGLPDGTYIIAAYPDENSEFTPSMPKTITVANGAVSDANLEVDFTNPMITGTVKNPDGTLAASGYVNIYPQNTATTQSATIINNKASINNGKFLLGSLPDGTYTIVACPGENSEFTPSIPKTITIANGAVSPASDANLEMDFTNPMITGTVKNPDGTTAAHTYVYIWPQNGPQIGTAPIVTIINNGKFLIGSLPDGTYNIVAYPYENNEYLPSMTKTITIVNGAVSPAADANIELDFTSPLITGTVKSPDGTLVTGGTVNIYNQNNNIVSSIGVKDGSFLIENLPDGTYTLIATCTNFPYMQYGDSAPKTITIVNGAVSSAADANIELDFTNPLITGTVKNPDGTLATGGNVMIYSQNGYGNEVGIQNDGSFAIGSLADGVYTIYAVTADGKSCNSLPKTITIVDGAVSPASDANIELNLTAPQIKGTVKNPDGTNPNFGGSVRVSNQNGVLVSTAFTNNDMFAIGNLPDGTYNLVAIPYPYGNNQFNQSAAKTITIINGAVSPASDANIELDFTNPQSTTGSATLVNIEQPYTVNVPTGVALYNLPLPQVIALDTTTAAGATMSQLANVSWGQAPSQYNPYMEGLYTFVGTVTLPSDVVNPNNIPLTTEMTVDVTTPSATSAEFTQFDIAGEAAPTLIGSTAAGNTIVVTMPSGTDLSNLVASFTTDVTTPSATTVTTGSATQVSGITSNDFTHPIVYTITAGDGHTTETWTVNVQTAVDRTTIGATIVETDKIKSEASAAAIDYNSVDGGAALNALNIALANAEVVNAQPCPSQILVNDMATALAAANTEFEQTYGVSQ